MNFDELLEEFVEARKNGFVTVKEFKDQGKNIVGTFCTYTPKELIYAAGAYPVSLCAVSDATIPASEVDLPKNLCPLIKSSYGYAITDKCPYMYFSDLVIGETTCDGKMKMFELLGKIKDTYVMQLPHSQDNEYAKAMWEKEIYRLKDRLEEKFSTEITEEKLKDAIKKCNIERGVIKDFYSLGKLVPPPISGYEMFNMLNGVLFTFDKEYQNRKLKEVTEHLREIHAKGESKISKDRPRILITGCPIGGVADKIIKQLEEVGAVVVIYENCGASKNMERLVDETIDPMRAIAEKYLAIPCSVMTPNKGREELLTELIKEYKVDGVIDIILQSCHTYAIETKTIQKHVNSLEIPFLTIETDYSTSDSGQIRTRLEAFVEMI
ncbi:MAG: 2-hydroxyacyl-CoA dehydratase [Fusobacteriaceae bacterium]|nr:2-hydroxyacyl-CoA dehydratase [Fusobacteriaceae bacterium]